MKIRITSESHDFTILLPSRLIFSRFGAGIAARYARKRGSDTTKDLSSEAMEALFAELRRVREKHGAWTLVEVDTADGERVRITL